MVQLKLHDFHQTAGAHFTEINGSEVVHHYGDPLAEYSALHQHAGILDLSFRGRICLTGSDRVRFLHGQVTNDVKRLRTGDGAYAALITAKGKMQSDLNIYCLAEELLLDFEPGLTKTISVRLEKYVITDDVQVVDVAPHYGLFSVQGPTAEPLLQNLALVPQFPSKPLTFTKASNTTFGEVYVMNQPRLGTTGFDLFVPTDTMPALAAKLFAASKTAGARPCGSEALELVRLEAGIPRFGTDMDETNIPLEAGLETRAISFNKGCYIGQEVISRIHTYGQVAKALRGLRLHDDLKTLPAKGTKLFRDTKDVGYITSAAHSPTLNANIALAYVRKEVNQPGTDLRLHIDGHEILAKIVPLPFLAA
jgi:folate-binding protein YgfZ